MDDLLVIHHSYALYRGSSFDNRPHSHHALQFCFGLGRRLSMTLEGESLMGPALLIAPHMVHSVPPENGRILLLFIDRESVIGQSLLRTCLRGDRHLIFDYPMEESLVNDLHDRQGVQALLDDLFTFIGLDLQEYPRDSRIEEILERIGERATEGQRVEDLAETVALSPGRLQHLFKEQMGVPITRYMQWKRMISTVKALERGTSLTHAAQDGGFADSAHFSRSFKAMFGVRPKELFKASGQKKILYLQ